MKIISVLNQKGGSGKTTIATHLARGIQLQGNDVLLVDSDNQGSALDWRSVNDDYPLPVIGLSRPTLDKDLRGAINKDYIIIDGSPQATNMAVSAIKASDYIVIPVQPSPYDIWATSALVDLVKQQIIMSDGKLKAGFVISRAIKNTNIGDDVLEALKEYDLPILKTKIYQRVAYPSSAIEGKTVFEVHKGGGTEDMNNLVSEVLEELNNG